MDLRYLSADRPPETRTRPRVGPFAGRAPAGEAVGEDGRPQGRSRIPRLSRGAASRTSRRYGLAL